MWAGAGRAAKPEGKPIGAGADTGQGPGAGPGAPPGAGAPTTTGGGGGGGGGAGVGGGGGGSGATGAGAGAAAGGAGSASVSRSGGKLEFSTRAKALGMRCAISEPSVLMPVDSFLAISTDPSPSFTRTLKATMKGICAELAGS
mmetsp:Transcript_53928/g.175397  ORF Transcript_53928/g.175397 Transcript_53928/m.175397 type:complete len:144 (+) Transcript_53928:496-927(+)